MEGICELMREKIIASRKQSMIFVMTIPKFREEQRLKVVSRSMQIIKRMNEKENVQKLILRERFKIGGR